MINHPSIELIKSLSKNEIAKLKKFIKSPYHNNRKIIVTLFDEIIKFGPDFINDHFTKEHLFSKVIKKKKYNDNTMRSMLSMLNKLIYDFIVYEDLKANDIAYGNILLKSINKRGVSKSFMYVTKKCEDFYYKNNKIDTNHLYNIYDFEAHKLNFSRLNDKVINSKKKLIEQMNNLENMTEYFIIYFISTIISDYIPVLIYNYEYQIKLKDFISKVFLGALNPWILYERIKNNNPYAFFLEMHLKLIDAFDNIDSNLKYKEYKNCIFNNKNNITKEELSFHICCLINLCNIKNNHQTNENTLKEEYELYLFQINNGLYIEKKTRFIPTDLFRNIILIGLKLKDFKNIEDFINLHYKELQPDERNNYYNYGYAFLKFALHDYSEAIHYSVKISIDHYMLKYDLRNITLKLYYELDEFDKAYDLIHSYREFLNNNIFTVPNRKKIFSNFIKYTNYLLLHRNGEDGIDIDYLFKKFSEEKLIGEKEWLKDKFEEILSSHKTKKHVS